MTRTPDIFLSSRELDARAAKLSDDAARLPAGTAKDRALKDAMQDRRMAEMKRLIGDADTRPSASVVQTSG